MSADELRDQLAGMAMQGMLAAFKHWPSQNDLRDVARLAYDQAEAMVAERDSRRSGADPAQSLHRVAPLAQ